MKAELYLWDLNQDKIGVEKVVEKADIEKVFGPGDEAVEGWVLCCDAFCCILDFSFNVDRLEEISFADLKRRAGFRWQMRQERFGGLLWNPHTGHVFKLDSEAFELLRELEEGSEIETVERKFKISATEIHRFLATISERVDTSGQKPPAKLK